MTQQRFGTATVHAHTLRKIVILSAAMVLAMAPGKAFSQGTSGDPVLRPGDALRVTVWRKPEFSGDFTVLTDGALAHPLLRVVRVAGTPMPTVEANIRAFLTRFETDPGFVVQPLYRIMVGGEVRNPSVYQLPPSATLAEAVAVAGGVTDRGKLQSVRLQRTGSVAVLDLTDANPAALANTPIRSGDQLYVARRASIFRDYIAPAGSIAAALAAIANIILR
jgi:polysaccharide export outer membrane protein